MYRSFFALPKSIRGADGKPVNALLGTANALLAAWGERKPRALVCCWGAEASRRVPPTLSCARRVRCNGELRTEIL